MNETITNWGRIYRIRRRISIIILSIVGIYIFGWCVLMYLNRKEKVSVIINKPKKALDTIIPVRITNFHATKKECGNNYRIIKNDTFFICSDGMLINEHTIMKNRIVGFSRDLMKLYNIIYKDTVEVLTPVELSGRYFVYTTTDTVQKNTLDILFVKGQIGGQWFGSVRLKLKSTKIRRK